LIIYVVDRLNIPLFHIFLGDAPLFYVIELVFRKNCYL